MAEQDIQVKVEFDTSQATASLKGVSQAAGDTAKQTDKIGKAIDNSKTKVGEFGSALGLAGQAAGKLSPALGSVVSTAAAATGVIQGLTTAGLGPLGLAIGVVSVALTAGISLLDSFAEENKNAERETRGLRTTLLNTADAFKAFSESRERAAERARITGGLYLGTSPTAQLELERQRLTGAISAQEMFVQETGQGARDLARLQQQLSTIEQNLAMQEALGPEEQETPAQRKARLAGKFGERSSTTATSGGGRRAATPAEREDPNAAARAAGEELDRLWEQSERRLAERRARWEEEAAFQAELNEIEAEDVRLRLESLERDEAEAERLREKNAEEHAQRMQAINDAMFSALESALASSVDAWLSGTRSMGEAMQDMVKQVAKSLASEAIIQGLKATAMGLGALAVGSPSAALHFAEAGKWAAVGVAAGVVGAASGAFGGGGGGGGGAPAAATGGPALTPGAATGAGTTVVINWGSSGLVYAADRAQLGRDISGMISEAHGRLGRGM